MQKPVTSLPRLTGKPASGDRLNDRELLQQLADFLNKRTFIHGDEASIRDMVMRYANPPFTLVNRVAMRMTVPELNQLNTLMQRVNDHLQSNLQIEVETKNDH